MTTSSAKRPFIVIDGDLRLKIHKGPSGMYIATSLDVVGLATQGKTVEDVISNAHDAAKALAESRAIMSKELAKKAKLETPSKAPRKQRKAGVKAKNEQA